LIADRLVAKSARHAAVTPRRLRAAAALFARLRGHELAPVSLRVCGGARPAAASHASRDFGGIEPSRDTERHACIAERELIAVIDVDDFE